MPATFIPESDAPFRIMPSPPPGWESWDDVMRLALEEARLAAQAGEVPVGAVVLAPDGGVLARARNAMLARNDPTAHAEILALRAAGAALNNYRLGGCFLAVSLEPCLMCAGALIHARIAGLIYGAPDPRAGAICSRVESLEMPFINHKPWQAGGLLADEASSILRGFFQSRRA